MEEPHQGLALVLGLRFRRDEMCLGWHEGGETWCYTSSSSLRDEGGFILAPCLDEPRQSDQKNASAEDTSILRRHADLGETSLVSASSRYKGLYEARDDRQVSIGSSATCNAMA